MVTDEVFDLVGPMVLTDEDIRNRALAKMGAKADEFQNSQFTETDQFRTARSMVKETVGDNELNGFYFQKPLKTIAESMVSYFMRSSNIDDVFESDSDLEHQILDIVKRFNPAELH